MNILTTPMDSGQTPGENHQCTGGCCRLPKGRQGGSSPAAPTHSIPPHSRRQTALSERPGALPRTHRPHTHGESTPPHRRGASRPLSQTRTAGSSLGPARTLLLSRRRLRHLNCEARSGPAPRTRTARQRPALPTAAAAGYGGRRGTIQSRSALLYGRQAGTRVSNREGPGLVATATDRLAGPSPGAARSPGVAAPGLRSPRVPEASAAAVSWSCSRPRERSRGDLTPQGLAGAPACL